MGGTLNAIEGIRPERLKIKELVARKTRTINEIILALNADMEGEPHLCTYSKHWNLLRIKISRLARDCRWEAIYNMRISNSWQRTQKIRI